MLLGPHLTVTRLSTGNRRAALLLLLLNPTLFNSPAALRAGGCPDELCTILVRQERKTNETLGFSGQG